MLSDAQLAANKANAAFSTGPRTEPGKTRSSRNALTFGLFTLNDFVRENETEDYTKICTSLWTELSPEGTVEEFLTTELMSATWRLRRCRMVEEDLAEITILDPNRKDPMQNPETEKQQKSVDRARAQSHSIFHRCLAALRKVQTERGIRCQAFPESGPPEGLGLMDFLQVSKVKPFDQTADPASPQPAPTEPDAPDAGMDALMALAEHQLAQRYREQGLAGFTGAPTPPPAATPAPMASNCKPAATVPAPPPSFPRNAPCRCGSGAKYKRCCGKDAAPVLGRAA
jgi:SEC-C motif